MKKYAQRFAFKHPTGRDLFETLQTELGQDLSWFFGPVFQQAGQSALKLRTASCRAFHPPRGVFETNGQRTVSTKQSAKETGSYVCDIVIENTGVIHVPVEIELRFADGSSQRVQWDDRGNGTWAHFEIARSSKLVEVWIDPDGRMLLQVPTELRYRLDADGSSSWRAAARLSSITQTLMQLWGL
jgi:hypothetical protein